MIASEVPARTGGRYRIEQIFGLDEVEAALGKERAAGGERALLEGARNGDLDLVVCHSASATTSRRRGSSASRSCSVTMPTPGRCWTDRSVRIPGPVPARLSVVRMNGTGEAVI